MNLLLERQIITWSISGKLVEGVFIKPLHDLGLICAYDHPLCGFNRPSLACHSPEKPQTSKHTERHTGEPQHKHSTQQNRSEHREQGQPHPGSPHTHTQHGKLLTCANSPTRTVPVRCIQKQVGGAKDKTTAKGPDTENRRRDNCCAVIVKIIVQRSGNLSQSKRGQLGFYKQDGGKSREGGGGGAGPVNRAQFRPNKPYGAKKHTAGFGSAQDRSPQRPDNASAELLVRAPRAPPSTLPKHNPRPPAPPVTNPSFRWVLRPGRIVGCFKWLN